jgi:hypothetical protein
MAAGLAEAIGVLESRGDMEPSTKRLVSELAALVASGGQTRNTKGVQRPHDEASQPAGSITTRRGARPR